MAEEDQDQEQALALAEENQNHQVNRSLHLKLKIPSKATDHHHHQFMKEKEEEEEEEGELPQQAQLISGGGGVLRTCSECGKQFASGKALGGHKRACLQKIKNHNIGSNTKNPKPDIKNAVSGDKNNNNNNNGVDEENNNNVCYVCHQSFRSVKSLYGHMRKHPEREWRGVHPPPNLNRLLMNPLRRQSASFSPAPMISHDDGDDNSMGSGGDLVESLKGWSSKRKRGHRLIIMSSSDGEDQDQDQDQDEEAMKQAVNDLLLLAQLSANDCANDIGDQKKKVNVDEMKDDDGLGFDDCNSKEGTWILKEGYYDGDDDDDDDDDDMEEMEMIMRMNQQKKNKKRRLNELDYATIKEEPMVMMMAPSTTPPPQTYSCSICNKDFDKHQALGGHVASHNKNKNVKESSASAAAAEDTKAEPVVVAAKAAASDEEETGESSSSEHKCNLCNKTFPTGQALGGHNKRCRQWTTAGPVEAFSNSSSQVTTTTTTTTTTTSTGEVITTQRDSISPRVVVVHDFDLNDTPPEYYQFHGTTTVS